MNNRLRFCAVVSSILTLFLAGSASAKNTSKANKSKVQTEKQGTPVLWKQPEDIRSRNLFYGPGGEKDAPLITCTFEKEDRDGTSPKFVVHDANGVKWKVKMGHEVRPETVSSRLVWAVGYSANEDYFLPELHVEGMPENLHRGQQFIKPQGTAHNVRLKRYLEGEKRVGQWQWSKNPFASTRELNGLRVMMALINNWDTKDANNTIYYEKHPNGSDGAENVYMVSDLGATFGTTGVTLKRASTDGDLGAYRSSKFILNVTSEYVDFATPSRPTKFDIVDPSDSSMRTRMVWIGRNIPRADVHWIGQLLAQLSPEQIRDAFRAAGYQPSEVEGFAQVVENRIADLGKI